MFTYIVKRLLLMVVTMFGIVVLTFAITRLAPGDPASLEAQNAMQGGGGGEARASIDDLKRQNRIIYGLDKPMLVNLQAEERAWFVRNRLEQRLDGVSEFDLQLAERELIDINTAAFPDLLPLLAELAKTAGDTPPPQEKLKAIREWRAAQRVAKTPEAKAALPPEPTPLTEPERAALLVAEGLRLAPKLVLRGTPPATTGKATTSERVAAWQAWWEKRVPAGANPDAWAREQVDAAFAKPNAPNRATLAEAGAVVAVPLARRVLSRRGDDLDQALALNFLAEILRRPGWRPTTRLIATKLAERMVSAGPGEVSRVARLFVEVEPGWMQAAMNSGDGESAEAMMRPEVKLWHAPLMAQAIFNTTDRRRQEIALTGLRLALAPEREADLTEAISLPLNKWITPEALVRQLQGERRGLVGNWWRRAQYTLVDYGWLGHTANVVTNTQFGTWIGKILRFDFDQSMRQKRPVLELIVERLPITLFLSFTSIFLSYLIAVPLGIFSAIRNESLTDRVLTVFLFILYSLPSFWVANMMILFLTGGEWFAIFNAVGTGNPDIIWRWGEWSGNWAWLVDRARHLTLPIVCYTYGSFAFLSRQMRSSMLEVVRQDFIRTARAKGVSERMVIFKHALRNSLIPILTLSASLLPALVGGSVIIEQIFTIKGMGLLSFEAILYRDYAIINAIAVFTALLTLFGILLADLSYALTDPRISYE